LYRNRLFLRRTVRQEGASPSDFLSELALAKHHIWRNFDEMSDPANPVASYRLQLRIHFPQGAMLGPGKARLLEEIRDSGSISAAGRAMEMSYKRAWMLVEEMNAAFQEPLVDSTRGGAGGGGARVTDVGLRVLALYRSVEETAAREAADDIAALKAMLRPGT
jgi:molybdate transport system regulatory protein